MCKQCDKPIPYAEAMRLIDSRFGTVNAPVAKRNLGTHDGMVSTGREVLASPKKGINRSEVHDESGNSQDVHARIDGDSESQDRLRAYKADVEDLLTGIQTTHHQSLPPDAVKWIAVALVVVNLHDADLRSNPDSSTIGQYWIDGVTNGNTSDA